MHFLISLPSFNPPSLYSSPFMYTSFLFLLPCLLFIPFYGFPLVFSLQSPFFCFLSFPNSLLSSLLSLPSSLLFHMSYSCACVCLCVPYRLNVWLALLFLMLVLTVIATVTEKALMKGGNRHSSSSSSSMFFWHLISHYQLFLGQSE